jgi:hypothetical protein
MSEEKKMAVTIQPKEPAIRASELAELRTLANTLRGSIEKIDALLNTIAERIKKDKEAAPKNITPAERRLQEIEQKRQEQEQADYNPLTHGLKQSTDD